MNKTKGLPLLDNRDIDPDADESNPPTNEGWIELGRRLAATNTPWGTWHELARPRLWCSAPACMGKPGAYAHYIVRFPVKGHDGGHLWMLCDDHYATTPIGSAEWVEGLAARGFAANTRSGC